MLRPAYPVTTRRLLLRPFVPEDLDALHAIQSRPDVARYLYWGPRSRKEVREALAARTPRRSLEAEGDVLALAVVLRDSGALVGDVNLEWLSREHRQGEVGFVFHPDHGGRGFATEAAREMLRLGFGGLGLHRIVGRCDARNAASARLMERLGMRRAGRLTNPAKHGRRHTEAIARRRCGHAARIGGGSLGPQIAVAPTAQGPSPTTPRGAGRAPAEASAGAAASRLT